MTIRTEIQIVTITRALADPSRLAALVACRRQELCACQLVELLGLSGATVSRHLALLRDARLLESRKAGRWMHYRLADAPEGSTRAAAIDLAVRGLAESGALEDIDNRLNAILAMDPAELCLRQRGCC